MARVNQFSRNPDAEYWHSLGLHRSTVPNAPTMQPLKDAQASYENGLSIVTGDDHGLDTESRIMQEARLLRDYGFVIVRQALRPRPKPDRKDLLDEAHIPLVKSAELTEGLKQMHIGHYSSEAWRYLRSENGATFGTLARWGTVSLVFLDEAPVEPEYLYEAAHGDLEKGSNRYYEVSNARRGELHSVITGNNLMAGIWRGRAYKALQKARREDGPDYEAAKSTYERITPALSDAKSARQFVRQRP